MSIRRLVTPVAVAVGIAAFATPALAQRRGGHGGVTRGTAVARSRPVYVPRTVIVNRGYYRPYTYYRPYYQFAPRFSLGIGLWAGYPVTWSGYYWSGYPYAYGSPYPYDPYYNGYPAPAPYPYGTYPSTSYPYPSNYPSANYPSSTYPSSNYPSSNYPSSNYPSSTYPSSNYPSASYPSGDPSTSGYAGSGQSNEVEVEPGAAAANSGGVSFEIDPPTASVFVDGRYMGTGTDFGPDVQPLGLTPGRHRVEIRAEGYESMTFDADVTAGQVTPYKASLRRR